MPPRQSSLWVVVIKTIVVHTVTYVFVGLLALALFQYKTLLASPAYSSFFRQTDDPLLAAGPLFQPIRGILFGLVFYLLQEVLFGKKNGWLITWVTLVILGIFSTFGPAPGSVEGMIYTTLPVVGQLGGLIEILLQSLLLSIVIFYWVNHPEKNWLNWVLGLLFIVVLLLPALGLLARYANLA